MFPKWTQFCLTPGAGSLVFWVFFFPLSQSSDLKYENKLSLEYQVLFKNKILQEGPEGIVNSLEKAYNKQLSSLQASKKNHHTRIQLKIL